jgi:uncharacterized protein (DUF1015 family)
MANILPFQALRYDTSKVTLEEVLTQPYDKITSQMQDAYYASSPHNLVRLELGKADVGDGPGKNVYQRAADFLQAKQRERILIQDPEPSVYGYVQSFTLPGVGKRMERKGFIALLQLQDYSDRVVYRHEQTLAKPKADRLDLLRATRVHSGQLFMVYSDPQREVDTLIERARGDVTPTASMQDEYGVTHQIWGISDPAIVHKVRELMRDQRLIIADGHHRYETALAYRDERRAAEAEQPDRASYEYAMATFINMETPGLVILPTHRVVSGIAGFNAESFLESARRYFDIEALPAGATAATAMNTLGALAAARTAFAAIVKGGGFILKARNEPINKLLHSYSPSQRSLDVTQLHKVLLEDVLGISEADIRNQTYVTYFRSAEEAIERVRGGADVALLMNPVRLDQFREVAFAGEVMPQKSTDFYPKLMSGITLYALD